MVTVTDFEVSPFVGAIPYPVEFRPEAGEVESIIEIPLSYLLDPMVVEERSCEWKGRDVKTLVYHYRGHAIWGATAPHPRRFPRGPAGPAGLIDAAARGACST